MKRRMWSCWLAAHLLPQNGEAQLGWVGGGGRGSGCWQPRLPQMGQFRVGFHQIQVSRYVIPWKSDQWEWQIRCDVTAIWHSFGQFFSGLYIISSNLKLVRLDSGKPKYCLPNGVCGARPRAAQVISKAGCHEPFVEGEWEMEALPSYKLHFLFRFWLLYFANKK